MAGLINKKRVLTGVKNQGRRDFIGGPIVKTSPFSSGVWVQSLVKVLRSHVTLGQKKQNTKQKQFFILL